MMEGAIQLQQAAERPWVEPVCSRLSELGLGYNPVMAEIDMEGVELLEALQDLGAVEFSELPISWAFRAAARTNAFDQQDTPTMTVNGAQVTGFGGTFLFTLDSSRYGSAVVGTGRQAVTVVAAPSLDDLAALVRRIEHTSAALLREYLQVYGGEGYGQSRRKPRDVPEEHLILPAALKNDLLSYIDAFGRTAHSDPDAKSSRGILLLGRPGTGKTMTARHALGRLQGFRKYLFVRSTVSSSPFDERNFEQLVHTIDGSAEPAIVVIEDIDRMFEGGATTSQYFLNVLDGLLEPSVPVLWLATSNDPGDIAQNLTDRPGRFDRVFLFPLPTAADRASLFELYGPGGMDPELSRSLAEQADGLTGAHIREICRSAVVRSEAEGIPITEAKWIELEQMNEQHRGSRDYGKMLKGSPVGFGRD